MLPRKVEEEIDVAIKRINEHVLQGKLQNKNTWRNLCTEAIKLAYLYHLNFVAFYGVVLDGLGGSVAMVFYLHNLGNLRMLSRNIMGIHIGRGGSMVWPRVARATHEIGSHDLSQQSCSLQESMEEMEEAWV
ncbi:serine/threonine-protein kinase CTR1 [Tanacetum coccineum]